MTIASTQNKNIYKGNGTTTNWPITFTFSDESQIQVYITDANNVVTLLTGDYLVDMDNNYVVYPGYEGLPPVDAPPILPSNSTITIYRNVPLTQEVDLANQGAWNPEVIENEFDKLTMITQQLQEGLDRSVKIDVSDTSTSPNEYLKIINTTMANAANSAASAASSASDAANQVNLATIQANNAVNSAMAAAASAASIEPNNLVSKLTDVVTSATPNKILVLDNDGNLPAKAAGLGTKLVDETNIADGKLLAYDASSDKLEYVPMAYNFRNKIINGDMRIDQRNGGTAITPAITIGSPVYTLDRWKVIGSQPSKLSIQQNAGSVTPPPGFSNYLGVTVAAGYVSTATDAFYLRQTIEGDNISDFSWGTSNAKPAILSFWVQSSIAGIHSGSISSYYTPPKAYTFSFEIPVENTWTFITVNIPGPTTGTWDGYYGTNLNFNLGSGSNYLGTTGTFDSPYSFGATNSVSLVGTTGATFYVTGVQLEKGTAATPFEFLPLPVQLQLCQRYFYMYKSTTVGMASIGSATSTTGAKFLFKLPNMRVSPTLTYSNLFLTTGAGTSIAVAAGSGYLSYINGLNLAKTQFITDAMCHFYVASGLTVGQGSSLHVGNSSLGYINFDAEI
jgi:hypothetical protein